MDGDRNSDYSGLAYILFDIRTLKRECRCQYFQSHVLYDILPTIPV